MTDNVISSERVDLMHYWAQALAITVFVISGSIVLYYVNQPIVEWDSYRQTMTALTSYWMIKEGWQLPYQTPGWGYPWIVPIEFPIYQSIVALIVWLTGLPLEPVGRFISFAFLVACAWPAFSVRQRLNLPSEFPWVFCALLWSSPLYLFWGRTFMIETTALFFTLAAIPYLLDLRAIRPPWRSAILCSLWGALGMVQKSITAGPVLLVLGLVFFIPSLRNWRSTMTVRRFLCLTVAFALPVIIGVLWAIYADFLSSHNPLGVTLHFRLSETYLGTIGQRLSLNALREIFWGRIMEQNAAGYLGLALLLGALLTGQRFVKIFTSICLVLTALPILMFFNVSLLLDYYQVSSVVFLIAALAISSVTLFPSFINWRTIVPIFIVVLVIANFSNFWLGYGHAIRKQLDVTKTWNLAIGDVINRYTPEESGIVVFGQKGEPAIPEARWLPILPDTFSSPEIPYLSKRKGFTVPDEANEQVIINLVKYIGNKELGAIVFCSTTKKDLYNRIIERYSNPHIPSLFKIFGRYVLLPYAKIVVLANGTEINPTYFIDPET